MSSPALDTLPRVNIAGMPVVRVTRAELAQQMVRDWQAQQQSGRTLLPKVALSINGQGAAYYNTDALTRQAMDAAEYIHADGQGVVLASRWLTSAPIPERCATTDFFHDAARAAEQEGLSFYFLGGAEAENAAAVAEAQRLYPRLKIAGRRNGYWKPEEEAAVVATIQATQPDVVWINLGKPKQEEFCLKYRDALQGVTWFKTCGGLYKFLGGIDKRAPLWMQKIGFEWFYRMMCEPRRLFWRYLVTNNQAIWYTLTKSKN